ncbi:MAG TPA: radical SAM protein [Thermoanaerobaculia bacterium]|jgi:MoaA/NifB/PqqE/SkfB family radical SAM enzyme
MSAATAAGPAPFDVFLRTGFTSAPGGQDLGRRLGALADGETRSFRLSDSFAELWPEVRRGRSPFVLFADQAVEVAESDLRRLGRLLRNHPGIPALTLSSPASGRVYGDPAAGIPARWVPQRLAPTSRLPSWFCVLNREVLADRVVPDGELRSLEFFLLDLGRQLAAAGSPPLRMSPTGLALDTRRWAGDLLSQAADHLASDYHRYRSRHGEAAVPPQLRVEIQGEWIPHPGLLGLRETALEPPRISILCPVFKPEFLAEMLGSVLQQSWRNWELLILVDGPPEEDERRILEILSRVASEPRIRVRRWRNRGTGPSRQALAEDASGDFLLAIDDDDLLPAHALEVFASAVRRHPGARCFRGGTRLVGLVDQYLRPRRRLIVNGISSDPFEVSQPFLISRETLAELGGFEGDPALRNAGEDTDLFHKLDQARVRTLIIDEPLYFRRLGHGNLSLSFEHGEVLDHFRNLERRFCPPGWRVVDRQNELEGGFQHALVAYRPGDEGPEVVTATRFFQYKTLGEESLAAIDLEITSVCNAVCSFCPREAMPDKSSFMPISVVQSLADQLAREPRQRQVVLCGIGESTLHPQLTTFVELLSRAGARVCMTTNGSRMSPELFCRLVDCGLKEINFSLNAATAETHLRVMRLRDFAAIKRNVLEILELKHRRFPHLKVHVSFVLCNLNQEEVHGFVDEWRRLPVSQIWIHPVNNRAGLLSQDVSPVDLGPIAREFEGDERVAVDIFRHHPEHGNVCRIVQSLDFISVEGNVRLCAMDYERKTSYGNIKENLLRHLYLEKILSYRRGETLSLCQGCDFFPGAVADAR